MLNYTDYKDLMNQLGLTAKCAELEKEIQCLRKQIANNALTFKNIARNKPEFIRIPSEAKLPPILVTSDIVPEFVASTVEYRLWNDGEFSTSYWPKATEKVK